MHSRDRTSSEFEAIRRQTLINTTGFVIAAGILLAALAEAASSLAARLATTFEWPAQRAMTFALFVLFTGALAIVIRSGTRRESNWSDHLKTVVSLDDFLQEAPGERTLAADLDEAGATALLHNLQAIAARDDVLSIRVGLLPEAGCQSDRVLIKTFAPDDVVRCWPALLQTDFQTVSTLRYDVDGTLRKVRSLLFVWD